VSETETFWNFSVRTYRQAGVADACLELQDEHGADVNLLLYCCWAGWHFAALDRESFTRALDFSQVWASNVVRPLRGVRRWMKSDGCAMAGMDLEACANLRETVKATELKAERLQQAVLESLRAVSPAGSGAAAGPAAVSANLRRYCEAAGISWSDEVRRNLGIILRAAFPRERLSEFGD